MSSYCNLIIVDDLTDAAGIYYYEFDGFNVVKDFTIYGSSSFNSGIIAHELGHYFNLDHVFNGCANANCLTNGDKVCDTPPKDTAGLNDATCEAPNDNCTTDEDDTDSRNPYRAIALGGLGNQPDMLENYMDYASTCCDAFTSGQKTRMQSNIANNRIPLTQNVTSCNNSNTPQLELCLTSLSPEIECGGNMDINLTIKNCGQVTITSADILLYINDNLVQTDNWTGNLPSINSTTYTVVYNNINTIGDHKIEVRIENVNATSEIFTDNNKSILKVNYSNATFIQEPTINCHPNNGTGGGGSSFIQLSSTATGAVVWSNSSEKSSVVGTYENFFCSNSFEIQPNTQYDITVNTGNTDGPIFEKIEFYIDYNADGTFQSSERVAFTTSFWAGTIGPTQDANLRFTTSNTLTQNTILRARLITDSQFYNNEPCHQPSTGQVEDYPIYSGILDISGCTNALAHNYFPVATIDDGSCQTCTDGITNGDETDVDCGGSICNPCATGCTDPTAHNYDPNAITDDDSCETCSDGVMNGDETAIDCGGSLCTSCDDCGGDNVILGPSALPDTTFMMMDFIESTSTIPNTSTVDFRAGNYIQLSSGFHAMTGSTFRAYIGICMTPNAILETKEEIKLASKNITLEKLVSEQGVLAP